MSVQATSWVWEHSTAQGTVLLVALAMADAANREGGSSYQSVATVAAMVRVSERTVQRALRWLEEAGEIEVEAEAGRHRATSYRFPRMSDPWVTSASPMESWVTSGASGVTPVTLGVTSGVARGDTAMSPEPKTPKNPTTPAPLAQREELTLVEEPEKRTGADTHSFSEFWSLYPGPRKREKTGCASLWARLSDQERTLAMVALRLDAGSRDWHKDGGQYIPAPLVWLRRKRWLDDLPQQPPPGRPPGPLRPEPAGFDSFDAWSTYDSSDRCVDCGEHIADPHSPNCPRAD